jgi:hypothetical protein
MIGRRADEPKRVHVRRRPMVAVAAVLVLAGCSQATVTDTVTETVTRTATQSPTASQPPATTSQPATQATQTFSGNGTKEIGSITVSQPSSIQWTCSRCAAFAFTSGLSGTQAIDVGSNASSGTSAVDPGTYPDARVISNGDWTIRITSGQ